MLKNLTYNLYEDGHIESFLKVERKSIFLAFWWMDVVKEFITTSNEKTKRGLLCSFSIVSLSLPLVFVEILSNRYESFCLVSMLF